MKHLIVHLLKDELKLKWWGLKQKGMNHDGQKFKQQGLKHKVGNIKMNSSSNDKDWNIKRGTLRWTKTQVMKIKTQGE
jgi:hypothetical protein